MPVITSILIAIPIGIFSLYQSYKFYNKLNKNKSDIDDEFYIIEKMMSFEKLDFDEDEIKDNKNKYLL